MKPYIVGERGSELFIPSEDDIASGRIIEIDLTDKLRELLDRHRKNKDDSK